MTKAPANPEIIWTAPKIGEHIGRSAAYVRRTLAAAPRSPVRRIGTGNLFAFRADLDQWLRRKTG